MILFFALLLAAQDGEPALREKFTKEFKDKAPAKRVEAVKKLAGAMEDKTILLLANALKDPAAEVRKASAETIAESTDAGGSAIKPLAAILTNKKEEVPVRFAAAKALGKAAYKAEPIGALVDTISGIGEQEKELYQFGADCTKILGELAGQDFGAGKETPAKWQKWWKENQPKLAKDDAEKLAAWKKGVGKK